MNLSVFKNVLGTSPFQEVLLTTGGHEVLREMRHKGTGILVASQDPPSVPVALIESSGQVMLHKFNSPAWLRHIQKARTRLSVP